MEEQIAETKREFKVDTTFLHYTVSNQKVLLRDRKSHIARHVASIFVMVFCFPGGMVTQSRLGGTQVLLLLPGTGVSPWERTWDQRPGKEPETGVVRSFGPTGTCENSTFPILRMGAAKKDRV